MGIDTLVGDIYKLVDKKDTDVTSDQMAEFIDKFGEDMKDIMKREFMPNAYEYDGRKLRLSAAGKPLRQLWYAYQGYKGETIQPHTKIKFMYGHMLEALLLFLTKAAGHEVTDEQKQVEVEDIRGHMDARIDGMLVDVKSASSYSFKKFKDGTLPLNDTFGYVEQLDSYAAAEGDEEYAWLAIDKQNGHICVLKHKANPDIVDKLRLVKQSVVSQEPPERCYEPEPDGKSGNLKLGTGCSYCGYKSHCYPELRTFLYSNGPRFLVRVEKEPNVQEIL